MRFWSLHPKYLDTKRLTAQWREGLGALVVVESPGRGYYNHPQVARWRETPHPKGYIAAYLYSVHTEAKRRGYNFQWARVEEKMPTPKTMGFVTDPVYVTMMQMQWEKKHLEAKIGKPLPSLPIKHPLIELIETRTMMPWEKGHLNRRK